MDTPLCTNCPKKDGCSAFKILDNSLNNKKEHAKITLTLEFLVTKGDPQHFEEDFRHEAVEDISTNAAAFAEYVTETVEDLNNDVMPMGAQLTVSQITNKEAFKEISEYIKVTHEQEDNR